MVPPRARCRGFLVFVALALLARSSENFAGPVQRRDAGALLFGLAIFGDAATAAAEPGLFEKNSGMETMSNAELKALRNKKYKEQQAKLQAEIKAEQEAEKEKAEEERKKEMERCMERGNDIKACNR
eukprot:CAMPEP_0197662842 /NCGR_PEP_ID=MMETSP1338-20131121/54986_1 /TAXON_ID=43686 ORGANISM="Pelagodinium beii, Strain RCC1491" /NCGR_SAMPLE_ID=MMETSP1338 /ASSEMBLY_ACC=CAM_ASM_000754 /LENGTH=126 /DNA_ID=CAMNT_0043240879 /DNA_START=52 /DNA_END=432 /DNA_ORIENTATION=+